MKISKICSRWNSVFHKYLIGLVFWFFFLQNTLWENGQSDMSRSWKKRASLVSKVFIFQKKSSIFFYMYITIKSRKKMETLAQSRDKDRYDNAKDQQHEIIPWFLFFFNEYTRNRNTKIKKRKEEPQWSHQKIKNIRKLNILEGRVLK